MSRWFVPAKALVLRRSKVRTTRNQRLRVRIEIAARVGQKRTARTCRAIDSRCISEERIEINNADQRIAGSVEDSQDVIDRLHYKTVACAESLIRRFHTELISTVGQTLLAMIETIKAQVQNWIGFGFPLFTEGP